MENYGLLLAPDIKLHRSYFKELLKLKGINIIYRAPKKDKHWTTYAEIDSNYESPILTGRIFTDHPDQRTMKKLGWVAELQENASIISVPYDLPNVQVGALIIIPSGLDNAEGRLFRIVQMSNIMVYPASITCQIVPEYQDNYDTALYDHSDNDFNLLKQEPNNL